MTEEQATKIAELIELYTKADIVSAVTIGIALAFGVVFIILYAYHRQKIDKWSKEYYATLTEEQKQAIDTWRRINK